MNTKKDTIMINERIKKIEQKKFVYDGRVVDEYQHYGSYPEMDKMVDSPKVEDRIRMANWGYGIDKLKDDSDPRVRIAVAKGDYYVQHFLKDQDPKVRKVASQKARG
jgi:hypothetical protein